MTPATEKAWKAYSDVLERVGVFEDHGDALAAFLEELADQVVPVEAEVMRLAIPDAYDQREQTRTEILAIAAELRGEVRNG